MALFVFLSFGFVVHVSLVLSVDAGTVKVIDRYKRDKRRGYGGKTYFYITKRFRCTTKEEFSDM